VLADISKDQGYEEVANNGYIVKDN